jgi:hypothetical protein
VRGTVTALQACRLFGGSVAKGMKKISYNGYRFPPEIIQQTIWLYLRFTLSFNRGWRVRPITIRGGASRPHAATISIGRGRSQWRGYRGCGDTLARTLMYEAAVVILTRLKRASSLKDWGHAIARRSGNGKARVAVARNLSVILRINKTDERDNAT